MTGHTTENYLREIYKLETTEGVANTKYVSRNLAVSAASATDMLKRLARGGLIFYERYHGARLTPKGKRIALRITRAHRLWEIFLVKHLGYSWDQVHDVADQLEHVTNKELDGRLEKFLGYPAVDPHGDPIPDRDGHIAKNKTTLLSDITTRTNCIVRRVSDDRSEVLQYVSKLGITIGAKIRVIEFIAADASIVIKIGAKKHHLSKILAENISVEVAS